MITLPTTQQQQYRPGFTILEIMVVLAVIAIIFAGSLLLLSSKSDDAIHTLPGEIENLIKTSLEKTTQNKQTHYLHVSKNSIWLGTRDDEEKPTSTTTLQIPLPSNSSISYKAPSSDRWNLIQSNRDIVHLAFSTSGICEPVSLRISIDDSYAECDFHPLTGTLILP